MALITPKPKLDAGFTANRMTIFVTLSGKQLGCGSLQPEVAVGRRRIALARSGSASQSRSDTVASGILGFVEGGIGGVQHLFQIRSRLGGGHT